jgi:hypothetical protein
LGPKPQEEIFGNKTNMKSNIDKFKKLPKKKLKY